MKVFTGSAGDPTLWYLHFWSELGVLNPKKAWISLKNPTPKAWKTQQKNLKQPQNPAKTSKNTKNPKQP